jgi:uncharacterized protein DUF3156
VVGRARKRAAAALADNLAVFARAGYRESGRPDVFTAHLDAPAGGRSLVLRMAPDGRILGGTFGLEISTAEPVLPATRGVSARGRGVVKLRGLAFRARGRDPEGARLAERLRGDAELAEALGQVHFERIRIEQDGRPVIRHMGGSVVWILFPPLVRPIPLLESQAQASTRALEAFARAGSLL